MEIFKVFGINMISNMNKVSGKKKIESTRQEGAGILKLGDFMNKKKNNLYVNQKKREKQ